jgi:6-pyruvoyltetrahydropterin/6-carboxytetrahydropterin synthase
MPSFLTRRVTFAAAHRYRIATWSDERNEATFGACARPNFHGHSYVCDVTVTGEIDPVTGFLVDLVALDDALKIEVRDRFDHSNINLDVPEFGEGGLVPTGENLARFIAERVQSRLGTSIVVTRVVVAEDTTLSATYEPDRTPKA